MARALGKREDGFTLSLAFHGERLEELKSRCGGPFVTQGPVTVLCDPQ